MSRARRPVRTIDPALGAELDAIYADADALYAGWSCPASTDCCHFGRTGREPYVTSIELARIEHAVRASGRVTTKRLLPVVDQRCPLLTNDGRCSIYAARPSAAARSSAIVPTKGRASGKRT